MLYTQQQCSTGAVRAEHLSLDLGKSLACREGMFRRSHSTLPRYQNSHLFPLCQFGRSHHVRTSKRGCWADFPPVTYKDRRHHVPPGRPPCQPQCPRRRAGEQTVDFLPSSHFGSQWSSLPKSGKLGAADGCQKITLLLGGTGRKFAAVP